MKRAASSYLLWIGGAVGVVAVLVVAVILTRPTVTSDITEFLPVSEDNNLEAVRNLTRSTLSKRVVILVEGDTAAESRRAVRETAETLESSKLFNNVSYGPGNLAESVHELYFPHRLNFVAETDGELETLATPAGMEAKAHAFRRGLTGRFGPLVQKLGPEDPLLAYVSILRRLQDLAQSTMTVSDGQFVTDDGGAVLLLELADSPFDSEYAARVVDAIGGATTQVSVPDDQIHVSGFHRYTHRVASTTQQDMTRISIVSLVMVVLLFGGIWGRVRWIGLPVVSIVIGGLVAACTTALVFGSIHLLTIAFGASLIGVCVDYSIHLLNDYAARGGGGDQIWRSIALSAMTTSIGFGALMGSSVPALRQLSLFAAVGIISAVATAYIVSRVAFRGDPPELSAIYDRAVDTAGRMRDAFRQRRALRVGLAMLVVVAAVVGFTRLEWISSIDSLMNPAPELRSEDAYVQKRVSGLDASTVVVVRGADVESTLQSNDALAVGLSQLVEDESLSHFVSLHGALWSERRQRMNRAFLRKHEERLVELMREAFGKVGVKPDHLAPVAHGFDLPESSLRLEELEESPLGPTLSLFDVSEDGTTLVTYLGGISEIERVASLVAGIDNATLVRQQVELDRAYVAFRQSVSWLAGLGLLVILILLAAAYRDPKSVAIAVTPPVLAVIAAPGVLALLGESIGLAHIMGLLMVMGVGVDYGVMLRGHHEQGAQLVLSLIMAYMTSLAAFGTLTLSEHPVLHAIGSTIAVGTTCCLLVLPAIDGLLLDDEEAP